MTTKNRGLCGAFRANIHMMRMSRRCFRHIRKAVATDEVRRGEVLLDPFSGSGTVPLTGALGGLRAHAFRVKSIPMLSLIRQATARNPEDFFGPQATRFYVHWRNQYLLRWKAIQHLPKATDGTDGCSLFLSLGVLKLGGVRLRKWRANITICFGSH